MIIKITKEELKWLIGFLENTQEDINWKKDKIKIIIGKLKWNLIQNN